MRLSIINIVLFLILSSPILAEDVTILFKDSTNVEDGYAYASSPTNNYGRATSGGTGRVVLYLGNNYGNRWRTWFRIPSFKDSCDNHPGLIIDSMIQVLFVNAVSYDVNDEEYIAGFGIDSSMNWVEGNNAAAAQNCEMCWDSAQTVGSGTCATKQSWNSGGASGAGDTLGLYTGETEDSTHSGGNMIFDGEVAGDSIFIYLDVAACNIWMDEADANEGFVLQTWGGPSDQYYVVFYGSESNGGALNDSIPYFKLFGHTAGAGEAPKGRRRRMLQ